jgi:luciferase family oxidoreductase group 1
VIPFSVLDLSPIIAGGDATLAFRNSLDLAQHAERWGYHRYWMAEHHNMPGIASAATSVVIAHVAGGTKTIRVGSGGIMLPNHAPLVIAEQFGTLESLFPGRVDLGLGRAPGTDQAAAYALRRNLASDQKQFPRDVVELMDYFRGGDGRVRAIPGEGLSIPVWILGSSLFGAELAAMLGLPFAFASHFAPDHLMQALEIYRAQFQPSPDLARPYAMAGLAVFAADSDAEAARIATSAQQQWINLRRGAPGPLQPPVDTMEGRWSEREKAGVQHAMRLAAIGSPETVKKRIAAFIAETRVDEVMFAGQIYDHQARLRSFEILAGVRDALAKEQATAA